MPERLNTARDRLAPRVFGLDPPGCHAGVVHEGHAIEFGSVVGNLAGRALFNLCNRHAMIMI